MADRDLTRNGVTVDFFGDVTRMPAGAARLAIETGAPLLPVHCWFDGAGWGIDIRLRWTAVVAVMSLNGLKRSPRRWPTSSPRASRPTRRTGT